MRRRRRRMVMVMMGTVGAERCPVAVMSSMRTMMMMCR